MHARPTRPTLGFGRQLTSVRCVLSLTWAMPQKPKKVAAKAFSLIELLCVLAIIGLLAALLLPAVNRARGNVLRIQCVNNLRQVGIAFQVFAHDHNGAFPRAWPDSVPAPTIYLTGPGTLLAYLNFQDLSNELVSPKPLVCPTDSRQAAGSFATLRNPNLSYFVGLNATPSHPLSVLAGDRNVTNDWVLPTSLYIFGANYFLRWTHEMHHYQGNVLFADGHVEEVNRANLMAIAARTRRSLLFLPEVNSSVGLLAQGTTTFRGPAQSDPDLNKHPPPQEGTTHGPSNADEKPGNSRPGLVDGNNASGQWATPPAGLATGNQNGFVPRLPNPTNPDGFESKTNHFSTATNHVATVHLPRTPAEPDPTFPPFSPWVSTLTGALVKKQTWFYLLLGLLLAIVIAFVLRRWVSERTKRRGSPQTEDQG